MVNGRSIREQICQIKEGSGLQTLNLMHTAVEGARLLEESHGVGLVNFFHPIQQNMSHCVPNSDSRSSEVDDANLFPLPLEKGEVVPLFCCGKGGDAYPSTWKPLAGECIQERGNGQKGANTFEVHRESMLALDDTLSHTPFQKDEMLAWLQYPLDDAFSESYSSEQHCEQAFTSFPLQTLCQKVISARPSALSVSSARLIDKGGSGSITTDGALALGAQRAKGLVTQAGAEVFDTVPTISPNCNSTSSLKAANTIFICNINPSALESVAKQNTMNFPFFSQPAVKIKSTVQLVGAANVPSIQDRLSPSSTIPSSERLSSIDDQSNSAACLSSFNPLAESELIELEEGTDDIIAQNSLISLRRGYDDKVRHSSGLGSAVDVTLTSVSGESDYSTGKSAKDVIGKRLAECESKNAGRVVSMDIGPTELTSSTKRTRAAEIHNQSERRRRNKINLKMKALQELIPNANKTDKASLLDEAIEYVKMLQAQIQLLSMRTGMDVPPIMMPPGMQYLALQHRPNTVGLNMGLGPRVMDASGLGVSASPKATVFGEPLPGHAYHHMAGYPAMYDLRSLHFHAMHNVSECQPKHTQWTNDTYKPHSDPVEWQEG